MKEEHRIACAFHYSFIYSIEPLIHIAPTDCSVHRVAYLCLVFKKKNLWINKKKKINIHCLSSDHSSSLEILPESSYRHYNEMLLKRHLLYWQHVQQNWSDKILLDDGKIALTSLYYCSKTTFTIWSTFSGTHYSYHFCEVSNFNRILDKKKKNQ